MVELNLIRSDGVVKREIEFRPHRLYFVQCHDAAVAAYRRVLRLHPEGEAEHHGGVSAGQQKDESVADRHLADGNVIKFSLTSFAASWAKAKA